MRATVVGLPTPYPLAEQLPGFLQEDEFAVRYVSAFDAVLAPVISVLDSLDAYIDPMLAPDDFVDWLGGWVGARLDEHWGDSQRRASILRAITHHRLRGTVEGLRAQIAAATGGDVVIQGAGSTTWVLRPGSDEGEPFTPLHIQVSVDDPATIRGSVLEELVDAVKPAHLPHTIEVISR